MSLFTLPMFFAFLFAYAIYRVLPLRRRPAFLTFASMLAIILQIGPVPGAGLAYAATTFAIVGLALVCGRRLAKLSGADANGFLAISVVLVVGPLVLFKLVGSFFPAVLLQSLLKAGDAARLAYLAPLGISYLTFRMLAYLAEIRAGRMTPVGWWALLRYAIFWPTLIAGPIERPRPFMDQEIPAPVITSEDTALGLARIAVGCIKTLILGAAFGRLAGPLTGMETMFGSLSYTHLTAAGAWASLIAYSLHLYLDFSGYSDIAIGLARLLGYRIMENFRWPILATNIADFWRRWHISLTSLVTDYVYIPMGGNRKGAKIAARNTLLAMVLVGLWHGLNPHFVWWGAYHGLLLIAYRYWRKQGRARVTSAVPAIAGFFGAGPGRVVATLAAWALTFTLVTLGWLLFFLPADLALDVALKLFGVAPWELDLTQFIPM